MASEKIFISYKRKDFDRVVKIKEEIEREVGTPCWFDLDGIETDAQFVEVIMEAIKGCEIFLFMYSKRHSEITDFDNDWTAKEINFAQKKDKRIIFVNIDSTPLSDYFEFSFGLKQQVDYNDLRYRNRLYEDLRKWCGTENMQPQAEPQKEQPKQKEVPTVAQAKPQVETPALPSVPMIAGHEYVDLGLSVKWATCNVGASSPKECGDYFAWGETKPKKEYTEENSVTYGDAIIGSTGNAQYDAARANWGGRWRLPTKEEIQELLDNCTHKWTTRNGVKGLLFTSKKNGKSIFFPAAGLHYGSSLYRAGEYGGYWSATPDESNSSRACSLDFSSGSAGWNWGNRYYGRSVGPVTE